MKEALKNSIEKNLQKLSGLDSARLRRINAEISEYRTFFTGLINCLALDEDKDPLDFVDENKDLLTRKPDFPSEIVQMFLHLFDENRGLEEEKKMFPENIPHDFLEKFYERIGGGNFSKGCAKFVFDKLFNEKNIQRSNFHDTIFMISNLMAGRLDNAAFAHIVAAEVIVKINGAYNCPDIENIPSRQPENEERFHSFYRAALSLVVDNNDNEIVRNLLNCVKEKISKAIPSVDKFFPEFDGRFSPEVVGVISQYLGEDFSPHASPASSEASALNEKKIYQQQQ